MMGIFGGCRCDELCKMILQKVVLMMGIFGGCRCDELCKVMNCYTVSFFKTGHRVLQATFFNRLLTFVLMKILNPVL
jgi:hypothetical protein